MFLTIRGKKNSKSICVVGDGSIVHTHYTSESGASTDKEKKPKLTIFLSSGKAEEFTDAKQIAEILAWLDENSVRIIGGPVAE